MSRERKSPAGGSVYRLLWSSWESIVKRLPKETGDEGVRFLAQAPHEQLAFYKRLAIVVAHRESDRIWSILARDKIQPTSPSLRERWWKLCDEAFPAVTEYAYPILRRRLAAYAAPSKKSELAVFMGWGPNEELSLSAVESAAAFRSRKAHEAMREMEKPIEGPDVFTEIREHRKLLADRAAWMEFLEKKGPKLRRDSRRKKR